MTAQLLKWSQTQYMHLPWRIERTLYRTLVSEIMLQQTTVGTVRNHFDRFITQFPDLSSLASTSEDQMSIAWKGLGYYRRAKNLRQAAIEICEKYNGAIPTDEEDLLSIKGIGPYTAGAVRAIGANKVSLAIDANVERVLARYHGFSEEKGIKLHRRLKHEFEQKKLLKTLYTEPRATHEALMDVGRVLCQARRAECSLCPLKPTCFSGTEKKALLYPVKKKEEKESFDLDLLRIVVRERKKILGYKKVKGQWLEGQIEPPTFVLKTNDAKLAQYPSHKIIKSKLELDQAIVFKTGITKYKITNYVLEMTKKDFLEAFPSKNDFQFFSCDENKVNLATSTIKILNRLEV